MDNQHNNIRLYKNTLILYFRMILTLVVSLYTSRVILNTLGVQDYGTYNVVGGVVAMLGFFNSAMISATQRFLTFDLGRKNFTQLSKTFNATHIIHIGIAFLVFILAETIGLWFLNNYLNLPEGRIDAVRWVYHFSVLSFMINIIQVPYNSMLIAHERMNVYAYMSILEVLLKLLVVFMLTWITFDKLKLYSILLFIISLIVASIYRIYCLKQFEETRFRMVKDRVLYKTLINYSFWNLIGNAAGVAKVQGVSIILNIFFGTVVNAAQGVANQVSAAVNMFVSNFQMASNPQIIKSYAADDKVYMINLINRTAKFSFYLLFILILPILFEIEYILKLWLKIVPDYTIIFTILILLNALVDSLSGPLMISLQATGKIKVYQSIVGILIILILPISYFLFKLDFPPESTFVVSISIAAVALAFRLLLTKKQIPEFSIRTFIHETLIRNIPIIILSVLIPGLIRFNMEFGLSRLVIVTLTSFTSSIVFIYLLGLKKSEKTFVRNSMSAIVLKFKDEKQKS